MSKRLDYLAKARPEAATAYLTFLKEAGRNLDDKTRFLISVVTKVITGTSSGLKQYTPHAIRAGASGDEVLDAILMSFPAAGLTKVLDAIATLQDLDLPELRLENLGKEEEWHEVAKLSDLNKGGAKLIEAGERKILIYYTDEELLAWDARCPHLGNKLPEKLDGDTLQCKVHKWKFDIKTGYCIETGDRHLHAYPVKIEDDKVFVKMIYLE